MELPPDILRRPPAEVGHRVALGFLAQARTASARLADPDDATALHDFRVTIRRLRSTLSTWRSVLAPRIRRKDRRRLKAVQRATGAGRDAEVALAWLDRARQKAPADARAGVEHLRARLQADLDASMASVRADVLAAFARVDARLRKRLERVDVRLDLRDDALPEVGGGVVGGLARTLADGVHAHLARVEGAAAEEEAHEARIRLKRLRYHALPFVDALPEARALVRACKRLQDVLGDLNDAAVLRARLADAADDGPADAAAGHAWVARRNEARHADDFARLQAGWLDDGGAALRGPVAAFVERVEREAAAEFEIERKFLLDGAPALPPAVEVREIEQGYLPVDGFEDRLRRITTRAGVRWVRTRKFGEGLVRRESEQGIAEADFEALWPATAGRRVHKRRHVVAEGDRVWEVDEFLDRDLWLAEVELPSADTPTELPGWLRPVAVREVTAARDFAGRALAR